MSAVDIFTAPRMKQIEDTAVISGLVDANGNLLLSTRDGTQIDAGHVVGPPGIGSQGIQGIPGPAGTIDSATATGLPAGSAPTITLGGTPSARTMAFGLPKGDQGIQGLKGDQGIQGLKGDQGIQGLIGPAGTIDSATATGLAAGAAPTITLGGTPSARTMVFGIPQGDKGDKGDKGDQGIQGVPGTGGGSVDSSLPAGTVTLWASDVIPTNWLICDGSAVSRTDYASLFSAIGTKYGAGDGVNTFNVPNLKGRVPMGKDTAQTEFAALAQTGGEKTHLQTINEMPSHTHQFDPTNQPAFINGTNPSVGAASGTNWGIKYPNTQTATMGTGGGAAFNVLQPYSVVNFIIKTSAGTTSGDSELAVRLNAVEAVTSATPAGTISLWTGDAAPTNWMLCDGSAISRTTYGSLFDAIGTKYGSGDGVNTFNLPNLKGRVPVGKDASQTEFAAIAQTGGEKTHLLSVNEMPGHAHNILQGPNGLGLVLVDGNIPDASPSVNRQSLAVGSGSTYKYLMDSTVGGGAAHNVLQPYSVVNFIIKVTNGDTRGDSQLTQRVSALESNASATPAGTVTIWGGTAAPTNWLLCDGSAISRTTYASLFAAIGTAYGVGDGSTTFNLPNLKGRVPVGFDSSQTEFNALGKTGGTKTHNHQHISPIGKASNNGYMLDVNGAQVDLIGHYDFYSVVNPTAFVGGAQGPTSGAMEIHAVTSSDSGTLQPYQAFNYIIKFTNGDTKADSQLTTRVSVVESGTGMAARIDRKTALCQAAMVGGGLSGQVGKVTDGTFMWSQPFYMTCGMDDLAPSGYFSIVMPPDGTVIPVVGHPTVTSITVSGGVINMKTLSGWSSLYYNIPYGSPSASQPGRFLIVDLSYGLSAPIPPSCVLVMARTVSGYAPQWKWGNGRQQDFWHTMTLANGWVNYSGGTSGYDLAQYKITHDGEIVCRGLISSGSSYISTMPGATYGPEQIAIFLVQSNTGMARIDVYPNASILLQSYMAGGSNGYVSLNGIRWYPGTG